MSQISHISIKDIEKENRMDAEFHRNIFINPKLEYDYIWNLLKKNTQYWISIDMNLDWKWYKIYRMNEIENMFCNTEVEKYADIEEKEMEKFKLNDRDVLFNRTNSFEFVWRTWLFRKYSDENLVFASYLIRVNPDENKILPEYLTAFLNTKYWIFDIKRRAKISINQSNVSAEELKKIKIPILDMHKQEEIKSLFDTSFFYKQQSKQLYQEAENLLLTELGFKDHTFSHALTFTTTKKEVDQAGRYDADYFQPKYDEIIGKIENYKGWSISLSDKEIKDKNFFPKTWLEYKYIALADVSSQWYIIDHKKELGEYLPTRARRLVNEWDVVVSSIEWSLSSCAIIEDEYNNAVVSNGFFVLKSDKLTPEALLILIKSEFMQLLLKKNSSWTILTAVSKDGLQKLKLPLIDPQIQQLISAKVQESFKLRSESKQLLEQAKKMVEDEIEKE